MALLDASCVVGWLLGEPGAPATRALIRRGASMSVLNRAEVIQRLVRGGAPFHEVTTRLDILGIRAVSLTASIADRAAQIRGSHYDPRRMVVSLADCVALATAMTEGIPLATSDQHLADLSVRLRHQVIPVANSSGVSPTTPES